MTAIPPESSLIEMPEPESIDVELEPESIDVPEPESIDVEPESIDMPEPEPESVDTELGHRSLRCQS